ncbi:MAG: hypothetical protein IKT61_03040 [Clostridia bacterium]|nr:hypothetical protein [Clostridia bacterium]
MENNNKYNKRRRSITEFRSTYSDNKKYFISTDKSARWQPIVKYLIIAVIMAAIVLASFVITDALLEISEAPFVPEETTTVSTTQKADEGYFENQVTVPADEIDDIQNNENRE